MRIKKIINKILAKIMSIKTPLNEEPFGIRSLERLSVGDLVTWSELRSDIYEKEQKVGIISELYIERRGNRDVALANVCEITNNKNSLSLLGNQKEVLVVNLEILSKVGAKNGLFSI